jgi:hypothetical protein
VSDTTIVTTGELGRRLDRLETTITAALGGIATKIDERPDWQDVRRIETALIVRISALEGWQTWALRLGAPGIVGALIGVLINAGRIPS